MTRLTNNLSASVVLILLGTVGCSTDERLVQQAEKASDRQADQNRQIAHQNQELAQATNRLVTADADARRETVALQRDLQADQSLAGQKRDELEAERREMADARHRDAMIAAVLADLGLIVACLLPLVLCGYLLRGLRHEPGETELGELLAAELVSERLLLLPFATPDLPGDRALPHARDP